MMTENNPKQPTVREATQLGENCGACRFLRVMPVQVGTITVYFHRCYRSGAIWTEHLTPKQNADYPPGRSVCDDFEAME